MSNKFERMKQEVSHFFPSCPLCQGDSIVTRFNDDYFARDYILCSNCHARWHIYYLQGLKWAELIQASADGSGGEYLGVRHEPAFWFDMIKKKPVEKMEASAAQPEVSEKGAVRGKKVVREKEIVREKEVIVKVKCQYCGKLYNEVLDVCPHCGGKR